MSRWAWKRALPSSSSPSGSIASPSSGRVHAPRRVRQRADPMAENATTDGTEPSSRNAVRFEHVDVIFGRNTQAALAMLDMGEGRDTILDKTDNLVAVHDASLYVNEGEILVLMGLS